MHCSDGRTEFKLLLVTEGDGMAVYFTFTLSIYLKVIMNEMNKLILFLYR
jgi:hypothetical protein